MLNLTDPCRLIAGVFGVHLNYLLECADYLSVHRFALTGQ